PHTSSPLISTLSLHDALPIYPLAPVLDNIGLWERLDKHPPTAAVVLMPDHVRDIDLFVRRYNARAFGPMLFFPDDIPNAKLEPRSEEHTSELQSPDQLVCRLL